MAHDLVSLITVLEQDRVLDDQKKALLLEKVTSLKNLLEKSIHLSDEINSEIRDAAHEAEDIIESHEVDQMLSETDDASIDHLLFDVIKKFEAANDKFTKIIIKEDDDHQTNSHDEGDAISSNPSLSDITNTGLMVGFDDDMLHLKERLTSDIRKREIIPIVGMGGIGKTTLARNLYHDPLICDHFDVRAWVTVSQDYNSEAIRSGLLGGMITRRKYDDKSCNNLGDKLYQRLCGRRYLIVLDDIWSEKAWDEIQRYFPKEDHRSRIMITSRELRVAKHPDPDCREHKMHLLSDAQGWDLLRQKVFGNEEHDCPDDLKEIGKEIVSSIRGLPLALSVIGGLLSVEKYSRDLWDRVARDVRSITDDHVSETLSLSYNNLPVHLKPCFLYMSAFPEDFMVGHSKLVQLLVAEGFLWRSDVKSLEDVAEENLTALVDRNLLSVTHTRYDGKAKSYRMHDLLRDLCMRKAGEEKFLHILKHKNVNGFRRVSLIECEDTEGKPHQEQDLSRSRSLISIRTRYCLRPMFSVSSILTTLKLVRVLDVSCRNFESFPREIINLANLRFLAVSFDGDLPNAIWRLRNLETLLVWNANWRLLLTNEALEISSLRHIKATWTTICIDSTIPRVYKNLQTVCSIRLGDLLASNLVDNIPNIKKLGIVGDDFDQEDGTIDLSHLSKLESLKLEGFKVGVLSLVRLPDCLKKLSFIKCNLPAAMGFANCDHLKHLKIESCRFEDDADWELNEGVEFCSLQFLELHYLDMERWRADYSHFPSLTHLKIHWCRHLKEIPDCFGEMTTLEMIRVDKRNDSYAHWANKVLETQREQYGNETLQIRLVDDYD